MMFMIFVNSSRNGDRYEIHRTVPVRTCSITPKIIRHLHPLSLLISVCFVLTLHIYVYRRRVDRSILILRLAVVDPSVLRADGLEVIPSFWSLKQCLVLLVPGVVSCWVSITATGQSHWTALHYHSRGTHWHRGKLWSIWRRSIKRDYCSLGTPVCRNTILDICPACRNLFGVCLKLNGNVINKIMYVKRGVGGVEIGFKMLIIFK